MVKRISALAAVLIVSAFIAQSAFATQEYLDAVNNSCGTDYSCTLCHVSPSGGPDLNRAGSGFASFGKMSCFFCLSNCNEPEETQCTDADGDGYFAESGCGTDVDSDDYDASVHPGATEVVGDGRDNDSDGLVDCNDPDCIRDPKCASVFKSQRRNPGNKYGNSVEAQDEHKK